jgi:hypothetical protein
MARLPEDGGDTFLRNVAPQTDYKALFHTSWQHSVSSCVLSIFLSEYVNKWVVKIRKLEITELYSLQYIVG